MRQGFIFNHDKCVSCNACSAACILENGWSLQVRSIFTFNKEAESILPVINMSLACNHCETAVCMKGCPSSAYHRDEITGAVLIDEEKCIGCRYCLWNCPYDAPKFDKDKRIITKCNLCYTGFADGLQPSCSTACPTGALSFGSLSDKAKGWIYPWFPDKNLEPAIEFTSFNNNPPLRVIPGDASPKNISVRKRQKKNIAPELSLIIFSFLATISVSIIAISFLKGLYPKDYIFVPVLLATGITSLFHLGKKLRSWRSLTNLNNSPLSREIAAFILFAVISVLTVILHLPVLLIASAVAGLIFLLLIDSVYLFSDKSKSVLLHPGQTFISALVIVSFLSGILLPFLFIALVKAGLIVYQQIFNKLTKHHTNLRFMRIAFLIIPAISFILHNAHPENVIVIIFLTGELFDRILFYIDFNPVNIKSLIDEQLNNSGC
jgi:Fe-S-cluster-containing dehydrogenase component